MRLVAFALLMLGLFCAPSAHAQPREFKELKLPDGKTMRYALVLPISYSPEQTYPVVLALPPSAGAEAHVDMGLTKYWETEARSRGWIVVSPASPAGDQFNTDGHRYLPALLDEIARTIKVEGGRFHLAGVSAGGQAAFRAGTLYPERFLSLTVLPGAAKSQEDFDRLDKLRGINVTMWYGENDTI